MSEISVIIPTYNCSQYIGEAVESVFSQDYKNYEIIVVDDGSTDNTKEILTPYIANGKIRYFYQENKGPATARNKGVKEAKGEYIAFLDADDMWLPFKLEIQMRHLKKHADIVAVSSTMIDYGEKNPLPERFENYQFHTCVLEDLLIRNYMGIFSTAIIRKDALEKTGGFREDLKMCEDHELWLRLAQIGTLHKIMTPTAIYRGRLDGLSSGDRDKTTAENVTFIKRIFTEQYPEYKKRYLSPSLAVNHFHVSIEYTELKQYKKALKYLFLSIWYNPFLFPEDIGVKLPRLRRFISIIRSFVNGSICSHFCGG